MPIPMEELPIETLPSVALILPRAHRNFPTILDNLTGQTDAYQLA
jgi:hypothetical protein